MILTSKSTDITQFEMAIEKAKLLGKPILFSRSFRFYTNDLLPLLTHPADRDVTRLYWEQPKTSFSMAGLGSLIEFDVQDDDSLIQMSQNINDALENAVTISKDEYIGPRFIGGHAFNMETSPDETWKEFPRGRFILPECLATRQNDKSWLTISKLVVPTDSPENVKHSFAKLCHHYENRLPVTLPPIKRVPVDKFRDIPDKKKYSETIFSVLGAIRPGKVEKAVISRSHHVKVGQGFSAVSAIQILRNMYPKCTNFMYSFPDEGIFFGSTPELLVRLKEKYIETEALAGTIARGRNMEEDRLLAETLFDSHKEREEHQFVIEQIKRKLEKLIPDLSFSNEPQILKLKNVQHLHTPISGNLKNGDNILSLVKQLHPTPAVAGTPTDKALDIIQRVETHDRGWYSGPVGWIDTKGDGEFCVALRSALVKDEEAHVFAGGGIVSESLPDQEWEETELKLQPILTALSGGEV